jgi:hypothetical protein
MSRPHVPVSEADLARARTLLEDGASHDPALCGTRLGYTQHVRFVEDKCRACRDAYALYQRERRAARKVAA